MHPISSYYEHIQAIRYMKKIILYFIILGCTRFALNAQEDLHFQAALRDLSGKPLFNQELRVRLTYFSLEQEKEIIHFSEVHDSKTDAVGLVNVTIGSGTTILGTLESIPWPDRSIWLGVEIQNLKSKEIVLVQRTQIRAVPFAFHAQTANRLGSSPEDYRQKSQSINWSTSGNSLTKPEAHFLGTRDAQDLVLKTNDTTRVIFTKDGQFQIKSSLSGPDSEEGSYPLSIQGSKQGIHIQVDGSRSGDNNFLAFGDDDSFLWGAVEGQTSSELLEDWEYNMEIALLSLELPSAIAETASLFGEMGASIAACTGSAASIIFAWASGGFCASTVAIGTQFIALIPYQAPLPLKLMELIQKRTKKLGVTYSTGSADYAEWIERSAGERDLYPGEIVGIRGGKVSLQTDSADHILVASTKPAFLGNCPQPGHEDGYEKIAFLGQVPVRVAGKVDAGDYIIASGNNDGLGVAVKPADMAIADYAGMVGVAWESAPENPLNTVTIGIGIYQNELSKKVGEISDKVARIIAHLEGAHLLGLELPASGLSNQTTHQLQERKGLTDEEFNQIIEQDAVNIRKFYADLQKQLISQGAILPDDPYMAALFADPVQTMKAMRQDPMMVPFWPEIDKQIINQLNRAQK